MEHLPEILGAWNGGPAILGSHIPVLGAACWVAASGSLRSICVRCGTTHRLFVWKMVKHGDIGRPRERAGKSSLKLWAMQKGLAWSASVKIQTQ